MKLGYGTARIGPARTLPQSLPPIPDAMTYDSLRGVVVLFNGLDTWTWDGSKWTLKQPATKPPQRNGHAMAFDSARGVVVLFGGEG